MTVQQHRPARGHALTTHRPQVVTVGDAPWIEFRASRGRADDSGCPACPLCGTELEVAHVAHRPGCGAA